MKSPLVSNIVYSLLLIFPVCAWLTQLVPQYDTVLMTIGFSSVVIAGVFLLLCIRKYNGRAG